MSDQRLTTRMVKTWDKLAELTPPPMYAHFNQGNISDIWQQCMVLKIEPSPGDITMHFEYIGDKAKEVVPPKDEGRRVAHKALDRNTRKYLAKIDESVRDKVTVINSGTLVNERSKVVKYRTCLLPFTDKDGNVSHIVVGFSWMEC